MRVLGINAVFHDPAAALVVDGHIVAAAEEERFSWQATTASGNNCVRSTRSAPLGFSRRRCLVSILRAFAMYVTTWRMPRRRRWRLRTKLPLFSR
ncbi:carbamoyltransferase [Mycobacteroides abscessus subsp. abscessus]|nr:carbamoyltransferase [Mycobacteroides abscessus subsp. abscessus]